MKHDPYKDTIFLIFIGLALWMMLNVLKNKPINKLTEGIGIEYKR